MIVDIGIHLPAGRLTNEELAGELGRWTAAEIFAKTGVRSRCVALAGETATDLASHAVASLLSRHDKDVINFLILVTQSGDYKLPSSACLLQGRASLPPACGCLDINLACSGFVYGLIVAEGLRASGCAQAILLVNSDTYTHYIHPKDMVCRPIFGDGAAATLVAGGEGGRIVAFDFGTNGENALQMFLPAGGARQPVVRDTASPDLVGSPKDPEFLRMNGPEMFNFTLQTVPGSVARTLEKAGMAFSDIDYFVLHQANAFMLEALRRKLAVPKEKFVVDMEDTGNLVSASIPVVLHRLLQQGRIKKGTRVLLCGFGVGLSWATCIVQW